MKHGLLLSTWCLVGCTTYVVTTASDGDDGVCNSHCTLREAINAANASSDVSTIEFAIGTGRKQLVMQNHPLPAITETTIIDGTTQPGYAGDPLIELYGNFSGSGNGLTLQASNSTIRGLSIGGFFDNGIEITGGTGNLVAGSWIGIQAHGASNPNHDSGIVVRSSNNRIGGVDSEDRNVISENYSSGINLVGAGANNTIIQGNYIGTNPDGDEQRGNAGDGIYISNGPSNATIGGAEPGAGNVISGNDHRGIITYHDGGGHLIRGNFIGTGADGVSDLGNGYDGISLDSSDNRVGGFQPGEGNIIANNNMDGVSIEGDTTGNRISRNSFFGNGQAINLCLINMPCDFVTPNDRFDLDTGANTLINFPTITSITKTNSTTTISGTLHSNPVSTITVELYSSPTCDASGHGEGKTYLRDLSPTTNASGNGSFAMIVNSVLPSGSYVTALAIRTDNNTSEFSACALVP